MSRRMFRYIVTVNDVTHSYHMTGNPVCVQNGPNSPYDVEFWAENDSSANGTDRQFQVFGTGQPLPENALYIGTAPRTKENLVWHLYEVTS